MTLKKVNDKVSDSNLKCLKSFNKKRVNKSVNSVIKEESIDSENRRIQIWAVSFWILFSKVESKFDCFKFRFFIALISNFIFKDFVRVQRNKNREDLKWKRA